MAKETWESVYTAPVEDKFNTFYNIFIYYFNISFPLRTIQKTIKKNNWLTDSLKLDKQEIVKLARQARFTKENKLNNIIKEKKQEYNKKIIITKRNFFDSKIANSTNVIKTTWNIINSETGSNNSKKHSFSNTTLNFENKTYSDPRVIANLLNNYFIEKCCKIKQNPTEVNNKLSHKKIQNNFYFYPASQEEIESIINSLQNKYSSGKDDVPTAVIKNVKTHLSKILTHLINSSFVSGIFPEQLKVAKVVPIFKRGDPNNIDNYRPVSLLPSFSKIYEKAVYTRLSTYLDKHGLFDDFQHGFRSGKSVTTAAVAFIESIIDSVDRGEQVIGVFMDLSSAFDSVDHMLLLKKLNNLGVTGISYKWFQSFLVNRWQYVEITSVTSSNRSLKVKSQMKQIKFGVPQGSILGPLLFLCYLKNISEVLSLVSSNNLCLYADDFNLKIENKSQSNIEKISFIELSNIKQFLTSHHLNLNIAKTKYMSFSTIQNKKNLNPTILLGKDCLDRNSHIKFLGLTIDSNLTWDLHIKKIIGKINSGLYALKKMSSLCNISTLKTIYFSHIESHIRFGICLYGSTKNNNLEQIHKLQKKSIRIILKLNFLESVRDHFKQLQFMTVYSLYVYECILYIRKNESSNNLINLTDIHTYNTRYKRDIIQKCHRLEFYNKKPTQIGKRFLKYIPSNIKSETNFTKFKLKLKSYLMNLCLYSLDELYNH